MSSEEKSNVDWTALLSPMILGLLVLLIASTCFVLWIRVRLLERIRIDLQAAQTRHLEAEHRLSLILDAASDPMLLLRVDPTNGRFRLIAANRAFAMEAFHDGGLSELGDLLDQDIDDVAAILKTKSGTRMMCGRNHLEAAVRSGQAVTWDDTGELSEGPVMVERSDIPILENDVCTHVLRVAHDVTDRWRHQQELLAIEANSFHSQKMEAIGNLAGGVAHDFNNILGAVVGKTNVAVSRLPQGHYAKEPLDDILSACRRAKSLVRQLLDFGRPDPGKRSCVDLTGVVRDVVRLMRSTASARIRFVLDLPERGLSVEADPSRLQQVVLNLVANAIQAVGAQTGTVKVSVVSGQSELGGRAVVLSVEDDGCGMTNEVRQRIFEPFFSTKGDEGSGWGLAVAHAAVREMGGSIAVHSEEGKGTRFQVELPASDTLLQSASETGIFDRSMLMLGVRDPGVVRLLLVDDEVLILSAYAELLEALGCQVVRAASPLKALEILENRDEAIDILVTDLSMPHLSGLDLLRRAKELRPSLATILLSGNLGREDREEAETMGVGACLSKPVEVVELRRIIDQLLGRADAPNESIAQLALPGI
jgi:signal transduction histidine kinase/ActR/RegA family two-component response regulator